MRGKRLAALVLIGLGVAALVTALGIRLFVAPNAVRLPLDQKAEPQAEGTVTYYDFVAGEQVTEEPATVQQTVLGAPAAESADDGTAVWVFTSVLGSSEVEDLNEIEYVVCLDRKTAEAQECDEARIDDDENAEIEGLTVTFPFDTQKRTYDYFNASVGAAFPAEFVGEEEIDGLTVYRFEQVVPETVVRTQEDVPGALAGVPDEESVTADFVYSNVRTMWVEPVSGIQVRAQESPFTVLRAPDGSEGVTFLAAEVAATEETVNDNAALARDTRKQIDLVTTWLPLGVGVLGALLLVAGALLLLSAARRDRVADQPPAREPAHAVGVR